MITAFCIRTVIILQLWQSLTIMPVTGNGCKEDTAMSIKNYDEYFAALCYGLSADAYDTGDYTTDWDAVLSDMEMRNRISHQPY